MDHRKKIFFKCKKLFQKMKAIFFSLRAIKAKMAKYFSNWFLGVENLR